MVNLKLVGSRATGRSTPTSDWDIAITGISYEVPTEDFATLGGDPSPMPCWPDVVELVPWDKFRSEAIKKFNIPDGAKVDMFCTAHCALQGEILVALLLHDGFTCRMRNEHEPPLWIE